ncbi:uncharacterized protein NECHADRAFT_77279 [Fusarium vanettenii 77-13-4]|uniref:Uncharacterized protein n=1 Tax=Fusarium vanettenii (strain ATCC MYA-4622 / CBS 123669 / FGSC 9596 / NRRL 45880 / 77-13-4) TaxID=660122 RepID=C7YKS6_FUSV7|nr:uncharacterized protein NECHADRAFT_77279 [Fusarium vanettenii 77-13-4]EEU47131.1 predicted protein [Fusarium vanettenii 77-13-4]
MSLLATYSAVLSKFTYDAAANFWKIDLSKVPCMYCLEYMDKDPRIPCITDQSPNCCLLCAYDKKKCGSARAQMNLSEMTSHIATTAPVYIRDDTPTQLLLKAINRLDSAENNPRTDIEVEGSDRDIMGGLGELYDVADQAVDDGNPGPTCPVSFVGQGPRLRGLADPLSTPGGRKRARPADGGDNNDEAPDPSPSRPPKRARKTRS